MSETRRYCWEITVYSGEGKPINRIRLRQSASVGRDEENQLCLPDGMVSRRHAEFQQRGGSLYLKDVGSTNGTYVNDVRIRDETILRNGDIVCVGGTFLMCHEAELQEGEEDDIAHGVVLSTIKSELTIGVMQKVVDVADLADEDRSLGVVCQATNALVAHHPLPELFDKVLETILDSIPAQRASIMLLEGQPQVPNPKATRTREGVDMGPIRQDIVRRVVEERKAVLVRDSLEGGEVSTPPASGTGTIRSVMCAPIRSTTPRGSTGRVLGLIYLDNQGDRPPLVDRDLNILILLANITATKIEHARLFEVDQQKQSIEEDMRLAASIQADLLPRSSPEIVGYRVCGKTVPCRMVGGDYFDFEYDGKTLFLALADVSGKGTGAAMLMVALRATVRAHWREGALTEVTARINHTFHQTVPMDKYATCFVARLDQATGRLEYVNAGHNRPLLIRPDGQWQRLGVGGTVVGAFPESTYQQEGVVLETGACLLIFSDGISDAWPTEDEADQHLVKLAMARKPGDVAALRAEIFGSVKQTNDDRTLIVVERLAAEPGASGGSPSTAVRN
jgi:phosphoserine phosphatase RsbU/P